MNPTDLARVDALTADGTIVTIRPVTDHDAPALVGLFGRATEASLRLRFFSVPGSGALAHEVARLTRPAGRENASIAAELAGTVVGVASYEQAGAPSSAEFAVFVDDAQQGRGIGTLLLEHLAAYAHRHGYRELTGAVLADNARMLRVAHDLTTIAAHAADGLVGVTVATAMDEQVLAGIEARDRAAGRASLRPLLAPRSVAVVGAGRRPGSIGHEVLKGLVRAGFRGPVYPVNPHADTVAGMSAYPSLSQLPEAAELVVMAVPAEQVPGALSEAVAAGARAAVILTAGFAEAGEAGRASQAELVRIARAGGIRLVGPNCIGVINTDPQVRLDASFTPRAPRRGGLAVASQSGAVGIAVLDQASRAGCGIASFVSLGNKADVSGNDLLAYWYDDPAVTAVALYLESFGNPRKFARVARALARRKPVLAAFSGRSSAGQRAGASHTAAAATPQVAVDTLFAQAGVVRADSLGELIDAARLLTDQPLPAGDRLAVLGNAGGANVLAADAADPAGLRLPDQVGGLPNPLDLGAGATPESLAQALDAIVDSGEADAVLVIAAATRTNDVPAMRRAVAEAAGGRLPVAVVVLGADPTPDQLPVFELPEQAVRALGHAARYAAWRRQPLGSRPQLPGVDTDRARAAVAGRAGWQPYPQVAEILAAYGIPLLSAGMASSADQAVAAAGRLGFPVALKAADPELVHKSELGAVRLQLADADAVAAAYQAVAEVSPEVLVQPMAAGGGVELVAGIVHDTLFGSLVMTGLGGVHTDLLDDRAYRLVPMSDLDAGRMWRGLRGAALLTGYRGSPPVDTAAVEDLLLRLGRLAEELPEVAELDLNPVLAGAGGVVAVDAKLRLAPAGEEPDPVLRRLR